MKKFGFTLAEALIAMAIIGIVAALTIPGLIKSYEQHVTLSKLKTSYSTFANAIKMSEVDNGAASEWEVLRPDVTQQEFDRWLDKYIMPYLKYSKYCKGQTLNKCLGKDNSTPTDARSTVVLANGVVVQIWPQFQHNIQFGFVLNSKKSFTTMGKDYFKFVFDQGTENTIIGVNQPKGSFHAFCQGNTLDFIKNTAGTPGYSVGKYACNKNAAEPYCCAAYIVVSGWTFPKDYPW